MHTHYIETSTRGPEVGLLEPVDLRPHRLGYGWLTGGEPAAVPLPPDPSEPGSTLAAVRPYMAHRWHWPGLAMLGPDGGPARPEIHLPVRWTDGAAGQMSSVIGGIVSVRPGEWLGVCCPHPDRPSPRARLWWWIRWSGSEFEPPLRSAAVVDALGWPQPEGPAVETLLARAWLAGDWIEP